MMTRIENATQSRLMSDGVFHLNRAIQFRIA